MKTFNANLKEKIERMDDDELIELCSFTKLCGQTVHILYWERGADFEQFVLCLNYNGKAIMDGQCWHWGDYYNTYAEALRGFAFEMAHYSPINNAMKSQFQQ